MRRLPLIALLVAVAGAAGWFGWQKFRPPEVTLAAPTLGPAVDAVYATGLVQPSLEIRIAPRAAGRIVALLADEGDAVKAGQLLAKLEDSDLRASVAELQSRVELRRDAVRRAIPSCGARASCRRTRSTAPAPTWKQRAPRCAARASSSTTCGWSLPRRAASSAATARSASTCRSTRSFSTWRGPRRCASRPTSTRRTCRACSAASAC